MRAPRSASGQPEVRSAPWEIPFKIAETLAVWLLVIGATMTLKLAEVLFAGTVTDGGTERAGLLVESASVSPPAGEA